MLMEKVWVSRGINTRNGILAVTGCKGLHFADYPEMTKFRCPELSHLTQPDAGGIHEVVHPHTYRRERMEIFQTSSTLN